jgi:hypothetical protein
MSNKVQNSCLAIFLVFALVACSSGRDREAAAKQKFQSIPAMTGSAEIVVVSGIDGGASDTCYAGYVEALYGTNELGEEVIDSYRRYAEDNHWAIDTEMSSFDHLAADNQEEYAFSITIMKPRVAFELHPSQIDQKAIDNALGKFGTVYSLNVVYRPGWRNC